MNGVHCCRHQAAYHCPDCAGKVLVKYRVHWADEGLPEETAIATGAARLLEVNGEEVLYIVREDQVLVSPREFAERVKALLTDGEQYIDADDLWADVTSALDQVAAELEKRGGQSEVSSAI